MANARPEGSPGPRGPVPNVPLVCHSVESGTVPCAELVKSFLIFPTKANWWENKETGLVFVFVFFCSASPVPRADSPARFDDSLYTGPLQIARAAPEFHSPWSSSIELHQRAARALLVRHVQLESPATGGLMQIAYLGDTR